MPPGSKLKRLVQPDQPQPFGREEPHSTLKPAAAQRITKQLFQWEGFVSWLGVEQAMQMHDEIAHLGVVDGRLRLRLPRHIGGRVIGKHADDLHLIEVLEGVVFEIDQLAADNEVKQLLRGMVWHGRHNSLEEMPGSQS